MSNSKNTEPTKEELAKAALTEALFKKFLKSQINNSGAKVQSIILSDEDVQKAGGIEAAIAAAIKQFESGETIPDEAQEKDCCGECQEHKAELTSTLDSLEKFLPARATDIHPALNNLTPVDCKNLIEIHQIGGEVFMRDANEATTEETTAMHSISTLLHLVDAFNARNNAK